MKIQKESARARHKAAQRAKTLSNFDWIDPLPKHISASFVPDTTDFHLLRWNDATNLSPLAHPAEELRSALKELFQHLQIMRSGPHSFALFAALLDGFDDLQQNWLQVQANTRASSDPRSMTATLSALA